MGQGHRVTFNMNTSLMEITKAYTSYMKLKEEKGSLTKGGQASRYLEQYYQVWDEYFWMTPEKGQLIAPATICWEQKEQSWIWRPSPRPKRIVICPLNKVNKSWKLLITPISLLSGPVPTGNINLESAGQPPMGPNGSVGLIYGHGYQLAGWGVAH